MTAVQSHLLASVCQEPGATTARIRRGKVHVTCSSALSFSCASTPEATPPKSRGKRNRIPATEVNCLCNIIPMVSKLGVVVGPTKKKWVVHGCCMNTQSRRTQKVACCKSTGASWANTAPSCSLPVLDQQIDLTTFEWF